MDDKVKETMVILQEECAEVIQAVSKILRFGLDSRYPFDDSATTKECLTMEVGQLLCMVNLLIDQGIIDEDDMNGAMDYKTEKLKKWSSILNAN